MNPAPSSSFCVVPWLHRLVDERGYLKVCCVAEGERNFLIGGNGDRLHIQDGVTESAIFNNPALARLRRAMLNGEWDPLCQRCLNAERAGGGSSRTARNQRFVGRIAQLAADTSADGTIAHPALRHLDLRLGNACNLTCRMCSPGASRLWIEPYNCVQPEGYRLSADRVAELKRISWFTDPAVWSRLAEALPTIEWLHFAGGEPMMIAEMRQALRTCVETGHAGRIHLSYTTNATLLPDEVTALWPHFKSVSLLCSVDGVGELNEYIRRPARWRDVDRHLRTLDARFKEWNLREVAVTTTVQVYNILDLDQLYAYLRSGFKHVLPAPILNPLSWPPYLSVRNLPTSVKTMARERLLREAHRSEYQHDSLQWLIGGIHHIIHQMDGERSAKDWQDFRSFTVRGDREFGDSFSRAAPELAALLDEFDTQGEPAPGPGMAAGDPS